MMSSFIGVMSILVIILARFTEYAECKEYTESEVCERCHTEIYKEWVNSLHASSLTDPVFVGVFKEIENKEEREFCISCHAPTTMVTGDYDLRLPITREGVTCDFCHTIKGVSLTKEDPYEFDLGNTKWGPLESEVEVEGGHKNAYSEVHLKAEFCAACHQVVNKWGFYVLNTYSEWKESPYAKEGIQCQNCHMPEEFGVPIVNPEVANTRHNVNSHQFLGGHSEITLTRAANISSIVDIVDDSLLVVVYVTNAESGHRLPTGIPSRQVILRVRLLSPRAEFAGRLVGEKEVVYKRVLIDVEGREIPNDNMKDMLLNAVGVKSDNRIYPRETRREEFKFPIIDFTGEEIIVESVLRYEFRVPFLEPNIMRMQMARDVKTINIKEERGFAGIWSWTIPLVGVLVLLFILQITFRTLRR
jgi:hypothetical protein